jgi:hypothetical protein
MKIAMALVLTALVLGNPAKAEQITKVPHPVDHVYGGCVPFIVSGDARVFGFFQEGLVVNPIYRAAIDNRPLTFSFDPSSPLGMCHHRLALPVSLVTK